MSVVDSKNKAGVKVGLCIGEGRAGGFTLVELLVVVAIIALVGSMGVVLYAGTARKMKVEKAARDFLFMARYARIMAIEKQREYKIVLDTEKGGFWLTAVTDGADYGQDEQAVVNDYYCKPVEFEGAVRFEDVQMVPVAEEYEEEQAIVFSPDGTARNVCVQIGDGRTSYTISIGAATGRAKIHPGKIENAQIGTIDLDSE